MNCIDCRKYLGKWAWKTMPYWRCWFRRHISPRTLKLMCFSPRRRGENADKISRVCNTCYNQTGEQLLCPTIVTPRIKNGCPDWIPAVNLYDQLLKIIKEGMRGEYRVDIYDTAEELVLHIWNNKTGKSFEVKCPKCGSDDDLWEKQAKEQMSE